ncbi:DUF3124 domain-containing protein [Rhodopseudomonas sp.]|uniref:DUF3124 domain-containing protein n=1 Tax=Rhodopseudomonas sp. TaxID=1078 RepID=UPI003B3A1E3C
MRSKDITRRDCLAGRIAACYRIGLLAIGVLLSSAAASFAQNRTEGPSLEQAFAASLTALPAEPLSTAGAVYVPAYSSVSIAQGKARADFSVTLSVHNASETKPLVIRRIAFFDGTGKMVQSYLKQPVALKPFATIEAFVPTLDTRGGTGANFVVDWAGSGEIAEPVVEALMLGTFANGHYAFISQGRPIRSVGR